MDELIAFVRAQLDEDERVARAASAGPWRYDPTQHHREPGTVRFSEGVFTGPAGRDAICIATTGETDDPQSMVDAEHIARWDSARVLAEVEAKRRVLDEYAEADHLQQVGWENDEPSKYEYMAREEALGKVVKLLAQAYAGRPGWREEWRV